MKLSSDMVRGFVQGKPEAELREMLRTVFGSLTSRELGIAADELLKAQR